VPIHVEEKLSSKKCLKTQEEIEEMRHVPYESFVGTMMYMMVCTQPNISHAVEVLR
jgi:hypothetical protein